jgi:hypothetical protein
VVCAVRADEAQHRDINHGFASQLTGPPDDGPSGKARRPSAP